MSNRAAGYTCPFCGFDLEMVIIRMLQDDDGYQIGVDLECRRCHYQWREINWE